MRRAAAALAAPAVLALLAGCGSSSSSSSSAAAAASTPASTSSATSTPAAGAGKTVNVTYQTIAIHPAKITVTVGTKIKWTNKDSIIHTVSTESGPSQFDSGNLNGGSTFEFTATKAGVIHYVCMIHPASMIGTITVTP